MQEQEEQGSSWARRTKLFALTGLVFTLTACNAVTGEAKRTIEYMLTKTPDYEMSATEIDEFPYTAFYMNQDSAPQSLVVLGFIDGDTDKQNFSWVSHDRETVVTRHGRVIRTEGLHANLTGISDLSDDPLGCLITSPDTCPAQWSRAQDFTLRDGRKLSREVHSQFQVVEQQQISLPAGEAAVTYVREHIEIALDNKKYVNEFWIEDDGHVVKSEQWVLYQEPRFTLTQVKWVGR